MLACALALLAAPVATAFAAPSKEQYVLELPEAGQGGADGEQSGSADDSEDSDPALTGVVDDGGLPILLAILVGTAAVGGGIAIMRRRRT